MPAAPYAASTIARWFLAWAQYDDEGAVSNLKLQKLLYYAQGHYLATHGKPLFADDIQAWAHGPVVPSVYHEYKAFAANPIPFDEDFDFEVIDKDAGEWLAAVWRTFGSLSAWRLREMTHDEPPWKETFRDGERHVVIPHAALADYFKRFHANTQPV